MSSIGIIIQARMGSSRLPGKVLFKISDRPLLEHVVKRLDGIQGQVKVVVATTTEVKDNEIANYCERLNVICFRGSENDVLARYYECALQYNFDHIVRLTADNPFTDLIELKRLIEFHEIQDNDYSHSFGQMPIGVGAEVFSFSALERSHHEGHAPNHREHVNDYIEEQNSSFKIGHMKTPVLKNYPELRLTVDNDDDYQNACHIAEQHPGRFVSTEEAIKICMHSA